MTNCTNCKHVDSGACLSCSIYYPSHFEPVELNGDIGWCLCCRKLVKLDRLFSLKRNHYVGICFDCY